jgi:hypothetical protein
MHFAITKRFLSLAFVAGLACTTSAQTPNLLATTVHQELLNHQASAFQLFSLSSARDAQVDLDINNVIYLKLDKAALSLLKSADAPLISLNLPSGNGSKQEFTLNSFNILDEGYKVYERGADGQKKQVQIEAGKFYRGIVSNDDNSLAAFTFNQDEVAAVFSTPDKGNYNLVLNYANPGVNKDNYLLFREADIKATRKYACGVTDEMEKIKKEHGTTGAKGTFNSCHKLRVSMHADYKLYQKRGSSVTNSVTYLTNLFNVISALYNNEGINAVMSETVVNSAPDNYTYGSSYDVLVHFGEVMHPTSFNGDIAHLVSGYSQNGFSPLGGVAWLDVMCATPTEFPDGSGGSMWVGPYSIANDDIMTNIPQVPVYSWDVEASAHEMGHNIGSKHTQSCSWPGGPIDNCVAVEDGNCSPGPNPAASGGTVMSYCHLTSWGINFAFGFGPLPGAVIRENMANSPCLMSFQPIKTLTTATTTRIANRQCDDGTWVYYYYDNNTATETDDELLLMIKANGQSIGNVDVTGMQVKMTTTAAFGTNLGRTVTAPYAATGWKEANRTWNVTLASGSQPTSAVSVRFPFTNQDVLDIKGSIPALAQSTQLSVVAFNSLAAATNPTSAPASAVNYYTNAATADATHWKLGTETSYSYAEFVSSYGVFGGSIGFKPPVPNGINDVANESGKLFIYPNPAANQLNVSVPDAAKASKYQIQVVDYLGRTLLSKEGVPGSKNVVTVDIVNFAAGVYNVRYIAEGVSFNAMFVKK